MGCLTNRCAGRRTTLSRSLQLQPPRQILAASELNRYTALATARLEFPALWCRF